MVGALLVYTQRLYYKSSYYYKEVLVTVRAYLPYGSPQKTDSSSRTDSKKKKKRFKRSKDNISA